MSSAGARLLFCVRGLGPSSYAIREGVGARLLPHLNPSYPSSVGPGGLCMLFSGDLWRILVQSRGAKKEATCAGGVKTPGYLEGGHLL